MYYFTKFSIVAFMLSLHPPTGICNDNNSFKIPPANWHKEIKTGPLQRKIDRLSPNETLTLSKGMHQGPILIKTPGVTILGEAGATINGGGVGSVIVVEASNVTIKGLTLTGSGKDHAQTDAGVSLRSANNAKITNNQIEDCLFGIDALSGNNILIEKNVIVSKNVEIGLRGDAIRLWNIESAQVLKNKWSYSRDTVSWYSNNITFKDNEGTNSRYSIHIMYSKGVRIQNNNFKRNQVGIFLMYGADFLISGNKIERSLGPTGMGIGIKESSNIIAQNNIINYSAVGVLIDNSPFNEGSRNWFHGNTFSFNGKGVLLSNDLPGGEFKQNVFVGNLDDVVSENRNSSKSKWNKNYWDKYLGFDEDENNIGDQPFVLKSYGESIKGSHPKTALFYGTPLFTLIGVIEKVLNIGEPTIILVDKHPYLLKN